MSKGSVDVEKYNINAISEFVKSTTDDIIKTAMDSKGLSLDEYEKRLNKKNRLERAIQDCPHGNLQDKIFVKDFILDLISLTYKIDENNINFIIYFDHPKYLSIQDKFDILLYHYKKQVGKSALYSLIKKYNLDEAKKNKSDYYYCIDEKDIEKIYDEEYINLSFEDKLQIVVQRIYSLKYGYNCIDEILYMAIDGVSGGVSGIPENFAVDNSLEMEDYINQMDSDKIPRAYDSVWIFFMGKSIHLRFLSFRSEAELKRICTQIYSYDNPGNLSKSKGYIVNELEDGSRIVVLRPPFCESWSFFVRKFETPDKTLKGLINGKGSDITIKFLTYLMKGCRTTAVTGSQGTGKTTLILAMIEYIYSFLNLRVLELAFELHIRNRFPMRNVITMRETDTVSGQAALDVAKKTDGSVNIIGEVASHQVASWMIQSGQVASLFTVFSHHAKTFKMLIKSLRNSLLSTGLFNNESIAEEQVIEVINFDIHLENEHGKRYIERITECIPIETQEYSEDFLKDQSTTKKIGHFMNTMYQYFQKTTERKLFNSKNIIEYDSEKDEYTVKNPISENNVREMLKRMVKEDREEFLKFLEENGLREKKVNG
ncbi:UNVERIFIED_CONTAM: pilus assembly protein CpaF [Acetivibrio alkalicellulosi]